jgi:hypothetical protein
MEWAQTEPVRLLESGRRSGLEMVETTLSDELFEVLDEPGAEGLAPEADELADEQPEPDSRTSPDEPAAS